MVDALTTLAVSMHYKKGTYALLLGSGISQSSQIPTGWDIVLDLIHKIAAASGEDCGQNPEEWYEQTFKQPADYSYLLDQLTQQPAERSQLIRSYIEPNEEQRDLGLRLPNDAHRAIADLVSNGYVRVIITTNFDRLLEAALAEVGIVPTVIGTADGVKGALPLVHNSCTILKLNGDYIDVRIKNTDAELERYPGPLNRLLDQIFYEYGLVICGWSGDWDIALVEAIRRKKSPWFGTYWSARNQPKQQANIIIAARNGKVITDMDADTFFTQLRDRIQALEASNAPESLSVTALTATVKRYIDDSSKRIRLHDLATGEANRVRKTIANDSTDLYIAEITRESVEARFRGYERLTDGIRSILATLGLWANAETAQLVGRTIERLGLVDRLMSSHFKDWGALRYYPTVLGIYSVGLSAVASGNYAPLACSIYGATGLHVERGERLPIVSLAHTEIVTEFLGKAYSERTYSPAVLPMRLRERRDLWRVLNEYVSDNNEYDTIFNRFEYLLGIGTIDIKLSRQLGDWAARGLLPYVEHGFTAREMIKQLDQEIAEQGDQWPPLLSGMFGGDLNRLKTARTIFDDSIAQRWY